MSLSFFIHNLCYLSYCSLLQVSWKDKEFFRECFRCCLVDENKFHLFLYQIPFSLDFDLYEIIAMELLEMDKPVLFQDYLAFLKGFSITKYKSILQVILIENSKILKEACHRENSEFIKVSSWFWNMYVLR